MAEANAQHRQPPGRFADQLEADARLVGVARPGRENQSVEPERHRLVGAERIVALHHDLRPQFAEIVEQVVGEAIVIVD